MLTPCPRCDHPRTEKSSDSPIPGVWEVYRCTRCNYVWRSSEKLSGIHKYDQTLVDRVTPWWPQLVKKKRG